MEHRWGRRIALDIPIKMVGPGVSLVRGAHLANLSVSGALVKAGFTLRVRSRIQIVVDAMLRETHHSLSVAAFVTHNHQHGIGVAWCDLPSPAVTELLRVVGRPIVATSHSGQPAKLSPQTAPFFGSSPSVLAGAITASLDERSSQNIATWSSYLATDCIAAMVLRGWDRTT
jgi:hypothetical protein